MGVEHGDNTYASQREFAVKAFNQTWDLIEKSNRTEADDLDMLHKAHSSRYHWEEVGDPVNFARGDWLLSRVYAVLGYGNLAYRFARQSLEWCEKHAIRDFDLAFAYEALARAYLVSDNRKLAAQYLTLARSAGEDIQKEEDRTYFFSELTKINDKL